MVEKLEKKLFGYILLQIVIATLEGILMAILFSSFIVADDLSNDDDDGVKISLVCPEDEGMVTAMKDGTIYVFPT